MLESDLRRSWRNAVGVLVALAFCGVLARCVSACDLLGGRAKTAVDVTAYTMELDRCIALGKDAGSFEVYDKCADEADKKFGRVQK